MDKYFRRVLYTALVAGGLMVVGASSAYAAGEGLVDPVTQGTPETTEEAAPTGGALDAAVEDGSPAGKEVDAAAEDGDAADVVPPSDTGVADPVEDVTDGTGADGSDGVVDDIVGRDGVVGSLVRGDVVGVVDGTLGEDGLVDGLLEGVLPADIEVPGPEEPGTDEPGTDEPGTEDPGTEDPGTDPGTDGPGILDPGAGDPGVVDPRPVDPGTDGPSAGPGTDGPGTGGPGTNGPGADDPRAGPRAELPEAGVPGIESSGGETSGGPGSGVSLVSAPGPDGRADAGEPAGGPGSEEDLPGGGVDISWGDKAVVVPTAAYDGTILSGGLSNGYYGTLTGLEGQVAPVVVPGDALAQTGPLITGQLALVSLLLGLGIVALRMRRRRLVV